MDLLAVGTVAYDSVRTPFGKVERALGGSGTYFSASASFFARVSLIAVVGEDFDMGTLKFLTDRGVDISGIKKIPGKTFHWEGEYGFDLNTAKTIRTDLNVLLEFDPKLSDEQKNAKTVFLANIDPELQHRVLDQVKDPRLIAMDSMNFWIENKPKELMKILGRTHMLLVNEAEARQLAGEPNLVRAALAIKSMGPKTLIIKQGEYGSLMFTADGGIFSAPAFPLESVLDPTGAGDSFAGGFIGFLSKHGHADINLMRRAIVVGSTMASFNVEDFSLNKLASLTHTQISERMKLFKDLTHFELA